MYKKNWLDTIKWLDTLIRLDIRIYLHWLEIELLIWLDTLTREANMTRDSKRGLL